MGILRSSNTTGRKGVNLPLRIGLETATHPGVSRLTAFRYSGLSLLGGLVQD